MKKTPRIFHNLKARARHGFTLLEMLVSTSILVVIMGIIVMAMDFTVDSWRRTTGSVTAFENARVAFTQLNELLSQATLNTYADYWDDDRQEYRTGSNSINQTFNPTSFKRQSELHFISGPSGDNPVELGLISGDAEMNPGHAVFFQAPLSYTQQPEYRPINNLLNSLGFYLEFQDTSEDLPQFIQDRIGTSAQNWRFRLMQWVNRTEDFEVYNVTNVENPSYGRTWFTNQLSGVDTSDTFVVAENIVQLILLPKLDEANEIAAGTIPAEADGTNIAPQYFYDSRAWQDPNYAPPSDGLGADIPELTRNQLPPLIEVVMIAIDEASAERLAIEQERAGVAPGTPPEELVAEVDGRRLFVDAVDLDEDLEDYELKLARNGINFRTFRNTVSINSAKWSPTTN
jgi:uncharacterized protein (TIGR02599 family)